MKAFYNNRHVLVTGGAGFIGSHLVCKLVELGAQVTILDNLSSGFLKNLDQVKYQISFTEGDITNFEICKQATTNKSIIFHLAALVSVPESLQKPHLCHQINVDGTNNLLEAARVNNVNRFVFSSSSAVYGPSDDACKENDPCAPASPYGMSKLIGELLCQQYARMYNMATIALRYFNVFGERQNPNGAYAAVVAKFTDQLLNNRPISIFGDGTQSRDFIHVSNVVAANLHLGMQPQRIMDGRPCNIATGTSITLLELFDQLKQNFPEYEQNITFQPARKGEILHSRANITQLKQLMEQL